MKIVRACLKTITTIELVVLSSFPVIQSLRFADEPYQINQNELWVDGNVTYALMCGFNKKPYDWEKHGGVYGLEEFE